MNRTIILHNIFLGRTKLHHVICEGGKCPGHTEEEKHLPIERAYSYHHLYVLGWRRVYDRPTKYRGLLEPSIYCPKCAKDTDPKYRMDDDAVFPHSCYSDSEEYKPTIYPEDLKKERERYEADQTRRAAHQTGGSRGY